MRNRGPSLLLRRARETDLEAFYRLAEAGGLGLTNLPTDRARLAQQLAASTTARTGVPPLVLFALEADGAVMGSAAVWPRIGLERPFYSFRIEDEVKDCEAYALKVRTKTLTLTTEFTGWAEVGGLIVDPALRGGPAGRLAARARYLFIAEHRDWFGRHVLAELRGWQDEHGASPVWEALGRRFFGLSFAEADRLSLDGFDMIAAMAPRHPIYLDVLDAAARDAIGRPHAHGQGAMRLLLEEGFTASDCVDVFDGGPTVIAEIDEVRAVRESRRARVLGVEIGLTAPDRLVSAGTGGGFRAARGAVRPEVAGLVLEASLAETLGVVPGDIVRHVLF